MDMMWRVDNENLETVEEGIHVSSSLFLLLILGFVLVVVGMAVILVAAVLGGGSASGGVVIFIGPFPIVIGAGPDVSWIVLFSVILAVLSVVMFLVLNRKVRRF